MTQLPEAVQAYTTAGNAFDLDGLVRCFADDALVNDNHREFWGRGAIRDWLARELVGDSVTADVVEVTEHHGDFVVRAEMDGTYDKTGLPDPLVLTHYVKLDGGQIVQLIIVHNRPA
jgi:ketosteroid isomerase-like protein